MSREYNEAIELLASLQQKLESARAAQATADQHLASVLQVAERTSKERNYLAAQHDQCQRAHEQAIQEVGLDCASGGGAHHTYNVKFNFDDLAN